MKNSLLTLLLSLFFIASYSQTTGFYVHGKNLAPVTKKKLNRTRLASEIIAYQPTQWMLVEISATCNGKAMTATGSSDQLNKEQKKILNTADIGTDVAISITHHYQVPGNELVAFSKRYQLKNVVPDIAEVPLIHAEYASGYMQLTSYLKESAANKVVESFTDTQQAIVAFTVNEKGEIGNAQISVTSGDLKTDHLLLEAITNMPKWKPAKNAKGKNVKQDFELTVGKGYMGGGC